MFGKARAGLRSAVWVLGLSACAVAQQNGGFETGALLSWTLTGAGAVVTADAFDPPVTPATGAFMGYLTTLNNEGAEDFGFHDESPDMDADGEREQEYSALQITFTTTVPATISMDLNFLTDELLPGAGPDVNDSDLFGLATGDLRTGPYLLLHAVAPTDGSYTGTAAPLTADDFSNESIEENNFGVFPTIPDASSFQGQTGFRHHEFPVDPGIHTWTFFVADSHTDGVASALLVDNFHVSPEAAPVPLVEPFGVITLTPDLELNGAGTRVDSLAFWEAPDPTDTLLFVTGKGNDTLEVWEFPFDGNELAPVEFPGNINGVAVDQEADLLYVSDRTVRVLSLPGLQDQGDFGGGIIGAGENNLAILKQSNGQTIVYVSEDHNVHRFDAVTWGHLGSFAPTVSSIETVLADDYYQMILVPEEQGPLGNPGVFAYQPDGTPFERDGSNRFGNNGEFDSDEEGAVLYTFPANGSGDFGTGFVVVADQKSSQTDFEFFDRRTWAHLGAIRLTGVSNTDGIASTQQPLPGYPLGVLAAINDDRTTVVIGWDRILQAVCSSYEFWAADRGLVSGVNAGFEDDPDHDGRTNLEEFATGADPLRGTTGRTQRSTVADVGGERYFTRTFPVRADAVFTGDDVLSSTIEGVEYTVAGSRDLLEFAGAVVEVTPTLEAGLPALESGWTYRTFRLAQSTSTAPEGFIRLSVTPAP